MLWNTPLGAWTAPTFNSGGFNNVPQAVFGISGTPLASRSAGALYVVSNAYLYCLRLADGKPCAAWTSVSLGDKGQNKSTAEFKASAGGSVCGTRAAG